MSTKWWFGAFRDRGAPTWYGDNKTPVITDPTTVKIAIAFGIFLAAFLVVFLGIRRTKCTSFLTTTLALVVGALLIICSYYPSWQVAEVWILAPYRSFSPERVNALLGVHVGLKYVNITLKGYPEGKHERLMNYNERFAFDEVKSMQNDLREGLLKGLPYPILSAIEYLSVDKAGFTWGRRYRLAGYYTCILLWLSFSLWLLHLIVLCLVPQFYSRILMCLGACILLSDVVYIMSCPKTLYIPFQTARGYTEFLVFEFGWCLWTTLAAGFACFIYGVIIRLFELRTSYRFFTFVHEYDEAFDDAKGTLWSRHRVNRLTSVAPSTPDESPAKSSAIDSSEALTTGRRRFDESMVAKLRSPALINQSLTTSRGSPPIGDEPLRSRASTASSYENKRIEQTTDVRPYLARLSPSSSYNSAINDDKSVFASIDYQEILALSSLGVQDERDLFVEKVPSFKVERQADADDIYSIKSRHSSQRQRLRKKRLKRSSTSVSTSRREHTNKLRSSSRFRDFLSKKPPLNLSSATSTERNLNNDVAIVVLETTTTAPTESDSIEHSTIANNSKATHQIVEFSLLIDGEDDFRTVVVNQSVNGTEDDNFSAPSTSNDFKDICNRSSNSGTTSFITGHSPSVSNTSSSGAKIDICSAPSTSVQSNGIARLTLLPCKSRAVIRRPSAVATKLQRRASNLTAYASGQNRCYKNSVEPYRSAFIDLSFPGFDDRMATNPNPRCVTETRTSSNQCLAADQIRTRDLSNADQLFTPHSSFKNRKRDRSALKRHRTFNNERLLSKSDWSDADGSLAVDWSSLDSADLGASKLKTSNDPEIRLDNAESPARRMALLRVSEYAGSNCPVSKLQRRPSNPHPLQCKIIERSDNVLQQRL